MNEITKKQMCVLMRSGIEIWLDEDRAENLIKSMETSKFIRLEGSVVNTYEIIGIYTPEHMEDVKRHKNGQWKCKLASWHDRGEKCACRKVIGKEKIRVEGIGEMEIPVYEKHPER